MELLSEEEDRIVFLDEDTMYVLRNLGPGEWKLRSFVREDKDGTTKVDTELNQDNSYGRIVINLNDTSIREITIDEWIVVKDRITVKENNEQKVFIAHDDSHKAMGITVNKYMGEPHVFKDKEGKTLNNPLTKDTMFLDLYYYNKHLVDELMGDKKL